MKSKKRIVILTGAGISAESGLKTFRDGGGLWENHRIEDVASPEGFERDRALVQNFYNERRRQLHDHKVKPNAAHAALVELENHCGDDFLLVTQNVDDLHERAGTRRLIHMHGELKKARCELTGQIFEWNGDILPDTSCPCCKRESTLRPHIVWFGEMPLEMAKIHEALEICDLFLSIGTSGQVYPAAGFVGVVPSSARTVEINLEPSGIATAFKEHVTGPASSVVPAFVKSLL